MADASGTLAHSLLRTLVLKTNDYFPFSRCNRWPYYLALNGVVRIMSRYPEVGAIYLRHGLVSEGWIPGLSDIDLSLVLQSGLPLEHEFNTVNSLRASYRRMQRLFPMLGELDILCADDFKVWLRATSHAPTVRSWRLLYGTPLFDTSCDHSPNWARHAVTLALGFYLGTLPPCLAQPDSCIRSADLRRRVFKILRLLMPVLAEVENTMLAIEADAGAAEMVAHACRALETAAARVEGEAASTEHGPAGESGTGSVVSSGIMVDGNLILVVDSGLPVNEIADAIRSQANRAALPVSQRLFGYMLRKYDPYGYMSLLRRREIVFGSDPLQGRSLPDKSDFAFYLLSCLGNLLLFTRGPELFSSSELLSDVEAQWWRLIAIRLFVEKGWVSGDRNELESESRRAFPEYAMALNELNKTATYDQGAARRQAFALFRALASEIRDVVAGLDTKYAGRVVEHCAGVQFRIGTEVNDANPGAPQ